MATAVFPKVGLAAVAAAAVAAVAVVVVFAVGNSSINLMY